MAGPEDAREGDPAALSLYGMLYLRTAVAAARQQDRSTANELLSHAGRAADQLGVDANHWQIGFGPANVELHRLSAALDLGDIPQVIKSAPRISVDHLPVERQVTHLIDFARALSLVAKGRGVASVADGGDEGSGDRAAQYGGAGGRAVDVSPCSGDGW